MLRRRPFAHAVPIAKIVPPPPYFLSHLLFMVKLISRRPRKMKSRFFLPPWKPGTPLDCAPPTAPTSRQAGAPAQPLGPWRQEPRGLLGTTRPGAKEESHTKSRQPGAGWPWGLPDRCQQGALAAFTCGHAHQPGISANT